tara:strand:+ start:33234 stop:34619 length:1386 start_codon:yes stop_codon:yes gene_type:complete
MTAQTTEQKFHAFKREITPEEFNSIEFLCAKAEQVEAQDPALAKRILVRVTNLRNAQEKVVLENKGTSQLDNQAVGSTEKQKCPNAISWLLERLNPLSEIIKKHTFVFFVVLPTLLFAFYQFLWATERFESQAQVIVQQPDGMATMDASMAVLTGLGVSNTGILDTELVKAYILSNDMLNYLDETLKLREHYTQNNIDYFSRLDRDASKEDFLEYYQTHLNVYIDSNSSIVHVFSQAFDSDFAFRLTQTIVDRAEWYINSIGHQLAEAQLSFIRGEHQNVEQQLEQAQSALLTFQQRYNLLDPTAEGIAMQQITYGIEGQISAKEAELKGLKGIMTLKAPQVKALQNELDALKDQLTKERSKLSDESNQQIPVSEILAKYTDLKVKMELALQAYTSSQVSLEKSRIEAYRQLKYLVVVESATKPEDSKYPDVYYNLALFAVLSAMIYAISRIILSTIRELK